MVSFFQILTKVFEEKFIFEKYWHIFAVISAKQAAPTGAKSYPESLAVVEIRFQYFKFILN